MVKFAGKGVYGAIAIGKISVYTRKEASVKREKTENVEVEKLRLEKAKVKAVSELDEIYQKALKEVGETNAEIFEIHMMMLNDEDYNEAILNVIESQAVNAEYAVAVTSDNFSEMFASMDDSYMQARAADVKDISNRLIRCLGNNQDDESLISCEPVVVCADDLVPSETVSLDKDKVLAFVIAGGSVNSHTAILARNMNIPAVVGVGERFLGSIRDGDLVIVDGYNGEVIIEPDEQELDKARYRQKEDFSKKVLLQKLKGKENITLDGTKINVYANIGGIDSIGTVLLNDAGGIGLFRSEFIYLENNDFPTEDEQFQIYKKAAESMAGKKVIIRTLDIGADKQADYFNLDREENPAMGLRAIRLCLTRQDIFITQLRAIFRASAFGKISVMFPMIVSVDEIKEILKICDDVKSDLEKDGVNYDKNIEIGIMIETPAAAIISDQLAKYVDFFSVGTNDLIQYTLACDRQNSKLDKFCDPHHDAVLRLIEFTTKNAHENGCWIGICGELASDLSLTETFLRMGIDELSVSPSYVLKLRDVVRNIDLR